MHMQRKIYIDMSVQKEMNTIAHRQMKHNANTNTFTHIHIHLHIQIHPCTNTKHK